MEEELTDEELKERYQEFWKTIRRDVTFCMLIAAIAGGFFALLFLFLLIFFMSI